MSVSGSAKTLRERIVDRLRSAILSGELKPGQRLHEVDISKQYETSRTPVREAFRQLESEGFLIVRSRKGAVVAPITERDICDFYELKSLLEGYAAEKAAERLSEEQINEMERLNDELKRCYDSADVSSMIPVHNEFHQVFVDACGNERLSALVKSLVQQFQRFRILLSHTEAVEDSIKLHGEIVQAFRARDSQLAASLVAQNSLEGSKALVGSLKF